MRIGDSGMGGGGTRCEFENRANGSAGDGGVAFISLPGMFIDGRVLIRIWNIGSGKDFSQSWSHCELGVWCASQISFGYATPAIFSAYSLGLFMDLLRSCPWIVGWYFRL